MAIAPGGCGRRSAATHPALREPPKKELHVAAPQSKPWQIVIADPGLDAPKDETLDGGTVRVYQAANLRRGISVSVYMQPAQEPNADHRRVREVFWKRTRAQLEVDDVSFWDTPDAAFVAYTARNLLGSGMDQRNVGVFMAHDGVWIDVQIARMQFTPADEVILREIARSVAVRRSGR